MLHKLIAHAYFLSSIIHNRSLGSRSGREEERETDTQGAFEEVKYGNVGNFFL